MALRARAARALLACAEVEVKRAADDSYTALMIAVEVCQVANEALETLSEAEVACLRSGVKALFASQAFDAADAAIRRSMLTCFSAVILLNYIL